MKKIMESIIPFGIQIREDNLGISKENFIEKVKNNPVKSEGNGSLIPGLTKLTPEQIQELGYDVNFYLKDQTDCGEDIKDGVVLIASIQNNKTTETVMIQQPEPISKLEIECCSTQIADLEVPGSLGKDYDMNRMNTSAEKYMKEILEERAVQKRIRLEKIKLFRNDPEKAKKQSKKAVENLRYKTKLLKDAKDGSEKHAINDEMMKLIGHITEINDFKSWGDLKRVPEINKLIEDGADIVAVMDHLIKMKEDKEKAGLITADTSFEELEATEVESDEVETDTK